MGGEVLGIGVIRDLFQSEGTTPVVRKRNRNRGGCVNEHLGRDGVGTRGGAR